MKYMTFCRGINWDCTASLKKNNEIYLLIKYIKSVLWRVAERLSYVEDAWCLKVKEALYIHTWKKPQSYVFFFLALNESGWCLTQFSECWHNTVNVSPRNYVQIFGKCLGKSIFWVSCKGYLEPRQINIVSNFWCEHPYNKSNWFITLSFIKL